LNFRQNIQLKKLDYLNCENILDFLIRKKELDYLLSPVLFVFISPLNFLNNNLLKIYAEGAIIC